MFFKRKKKEEETLVELARRIKIDRRTAKEKLKGSSGKKGDMGYPGDKGDRGDVGLTGSKGKDGKRGERGGFVMGPKGDTGSKGDKGERGKAGQNGEKGEPASPTDFDDIISKRFSAPIFDKYPDGRIKISQRFQEQIIEPTRRLGMGLDSRISSLESVETSIIEKIGITLNGGGGVITTGIKGDMRIPYGCTINSVTLLADQSGSIVIDIWKDTYTNFPPIDGDSITSATPPTITTAIKSEDSTLTDWTTSITADDILRYNVDSCTDITRCILILKVTKT